jgi:hypothetical protein
MSRRQRTVVKNTIPTSLENLSLSRYQESRYLFSNQYMLGPKAHSQRLEEERLAEEKEAALARVQQNGSQLEHVSEAMQRDKDVVLAAVSQKGGALRQASAPLKWDT